MAAGSVAHDGLVTASVHARAAGCIALALWAVLIAWLDLRTRRISNASLLAGLGIAVLVRGLDPTALPSTGTQDAMLGAAVGLLLTLPGYATRRLGAGDAKYAALVGGICGWAQGRELWLVCGLLLGLMAVLTVAWNRHSSTRWVDLPAGVALSGGLLLVLYRHGCST